MQNDSVSIGVKSQSLKCLLMAVLSCCTHSVLAINSRDTAAATHYALTPESKPASSQTVTHNKNARNTLPFSQVDDFSDVDRGFIAPLLMDGTIPNVIDPAAMQFMQDREAPGTVHPSLWRQAQLVNRGGLYRVVEGIYQVRGQDISNLTIIETATGIVLYDICTSAETFENAYRLYEQERGKRALRG